MNISLRKLNSTLIYFVFREPYMQFLSLVVAVLFVTRRRDFTLEIYLNTSYVQIVCVLLCLADERSDGADDEDQEFRTRETVGADAKASGLWVVITL